MAGGGGSPENNPGAQWGRTVYPSGQHRGRRAPLRAFHVWARRGLEATLAEPFNAALQAPIAAARAGEYTVAGVGLRPAEAGSGGCQDE
jgi:hypothetical protein